MRKFLVSVSASVVAALLPVVPAAHAQVDTSGARDLLVVAVEDSNWITDVVSGLTDTGRFTFVNYQLVDSATPVLSDFDGYESILVWNNNDFFDPSALGDLLADYVDAGGRVVVSAYNGCWTPNGVLGGRFVDRTALDIVGAGTQKGSDGPFTFVADSSDSPLLAGVNSFSGGQSSSRRAVTVADGATLVAHWSDTDSTPLVAYKQSGTGLVVNVNAYPISSRIVNSLWDSTTDGWALWANALLFVPEVDEEDSLPGTGSSAAATLSAATLLLAAGWLMRSRTRRTAA